VISESNIDIRLALPIDAKRKKIDIKKAGTEKADNI